MLPSILCSVILPRLCHCPPGLPLSLCSVLCHLLFILSLSPCFFVVLVLSSTLYCTVVPLSCHDPPVLQLSTCPVITPLALSSPPCSLISAVLLSPCSVIVLLLFLHPLFCHHPSVLSSFHGSIVVPLLYHRSLPCLCSHALLVSPSSATAPPPRSIILFYHRSLL